MAYPCSISKHAQTELSNIVALWKDYDADWELRCQAMTNLLKIIQDEDWNDETCFPHIGPSIKGLCIQMLDRRSNVCKQAAETFVQLSAHFRDHFHVFSNEIFQTIFKLLVVTIKIIADSAHRCASALIESCAGSIARSLPTIIDTYLSSNHQVLRARCIEYVHLILQRISLEQLREHNEQVVRAVAHALGDAAPSVRETARKCFALLHKIDRSLSAKILAATDPVLQKKLQSELDKLTLEGGPQKAASSGRVRGRLNPAFAKGPAKGDVVAATMNSHGHDGPAAESEPRDRPRCRSKSPSRTAAVVAVVASECAGEPLAPNKPRSVSKSPSRLPAVRALPLTEAAVAPPVQPLADRTNILPTPTAAPPPKKLASLTPSVPSVSKVSAPASVKSGRIPTEDRENISETRETGVGIKPHAPALLGTTRTKLAGGKSLLSVRLQSVQHMRNIFLEALFADTWKR